MSNNDFIIVQKASNLVKVTKEKFIEDNKFRVKDVEKEYEDRLNALRKLAKNKEYILYQADNKGYSYKLKELKIYKRDVSNEEWEMLNL